MLQDQALLPSVPLPDVMQLISVLPAPPSLSLLKPAVQNARLGWTHRAALLWLQPQQGGIELKETKIISQRSSDGKVSGGCMMEQEEERLGKPR